MPVSSPHLTAHLKRNRIAHTYLFTGPNDLRKLELALAFAKSLNCERGSVFKECGCVSCQKIERRVHPDVRLYGEDEKTRSLKIEDARAIIHEASLKPYEGRWKVFILLGAERLTLEGANALLKTFEEPPENSVFILLVENKAHLLQTIQSRSFEIRVPPGSERDIEEVALIRLLEERGWRAAFERLREDTRQELAEDLEALMAHFINCFVSNWETNPERSKRYLEALDKIYETKEAIEANTNQKLSLTHLEIAFGNILNAK
ncbi:MAG: DNA polymerase III subunit [Candidatus Omnitrophica bacterium]|nr:DNA polymerase III subunit [Candidatus Omnitrophota bacterium]